MILRIFILTLLSFWAHTSPLQPAHALDQIKTNETEENFVGTTREELLKRFTKANLRSFNPVDNHETMTFDKHHQEHKAITFYLIDDKVTEWKYDDREEMAKQYLSEFVSGTILGSYPKIRTALLSVMQKLPYETFLDVTDRRRPIIFIDYFTNGIAKYAGSMEFRMREDDPARTFENGFWIIRLGDGLNEAEDTEAIEGVLFHEVAHRVLENLKRSHIDVCQREIESNNLIKEWGYGEEFSKAADQFGAKKKGDSPCHDRAGTFDKEGTPVLEEENPPEEE